MRVVLEQARYQELRDAEQRDTRGADDGAVQQGHPCPQGGAAEPTRRTRVAELGHQRSPIWYPPSRTVAMTGGSPSLPRSRRMVCLTAVVNGSAAESQTCSSSSSAETTRPARASRYSSTANSLALRASRCP